MYIFPVWFLTFLAYAMWIGMFFRPFMEGAENVVATQKTESTPI